MLFVAHQDSGQFGPFFLARRWLSPPDLVLNLFCDMVFTSTRRTSTTQQRMGTDIGTQDPLKLPCSFCTSVTLLEHILLAEAERFSKIRVVFLLSTISNMLETCAARPPISKVCK